MAKQLTLAEVLERADEFAKRFEDYEPRPEDERDPEPFKALRRAAGIRAEAERATAEAVAAARAAGYSWNLIGSLIGIGGEAARRRYGVPQKA